MLCKLPQRVVLDGVPDVKEKQAARLENAVSFACSQRFIRHEHDIELAYHSIEHPVAERQATRISQQPLHNFVFTELGRRVPKHRFVQIRRVQFHCGR